MSPEEAPEEARPFFGQEFLESSSFGDRAGLQRPQSAHTWSAGTVPRSRNPLSDLFLRSFS